MSRDGNSSSSGTKRKSSRCSIKWPSDLIKLPPVQLFQLDKIIDEELHTESSEVVQALLEVTSNYKKDLKLEIRRNLSTEQKLQHNNIKVAKLAQLITHKISSRNRKLDKFMQTNDVDVQLQEFLDASGECNELISNLGPRLARIQLVKGGESIEKYGTIRKIWGKQARHEGSTGKAKPASGKEREDSSNGTLKEELTTVVREVHSDGNASKDSNSGNGHGNASKDHSNGNGLGNGSKDYTNGNGHGSGTNGHGNGNRTNGLNGNEHQKDVDMDEAAFEQFMASSISKYRDKQSKQRTEAFDLPDIIFPADFSQSPTTMTPRTPKTPTLKQKKSEYNTPLNSMKLSAKSTATTLLTLQLSHFKKLRINGSPITSKTYSKMKNIPSCDCSDMHDDHESMTVGAATAGTVTAETVTAEMGSAVEGALPTPSLQQSLLELSMLILHSEDEYNDSSGLATDDESDLFSTDTSDSEGENQSMADVYYQSLHTNLKKKKRARRNLFNKNGRSGRTQSHEENELFKADSPTPKHKPSHHTLKPKKSILKFPKENPRTKTVDQNILRKLFNNLGILTKDNPATATLAASGRLDSSVGFKFLRPPTIFRPAVSTEAAEGTILGIDDEIFDAARPHEEEFSDNESLRSIRSISRLRGLL